MGLTAWIYLLTNRIFYWFIILLIFINYRENRSICFKYNFKMYPINLDAKIHLMLNAMKKLEDIKYCNDYTVHNMVYLVDLSRTWTLVCKPLEGRE